mmetsp:Transcript_66313/g.194474  ORF Transcript_66313/g.194474 Transcript_66313/m.194474 type:complete len:279 (-) Transcript_66313:24-860(-)
MPVEHARLAGRPEVQPHPDPGVVDLEVLAELLGLPLRRVPGREVRGGAVEGDLADLAADGHLLLGPGAPLLGPWRAVAELLHDPFREALGVRVLPVRDELVDVHVREGPLVEARGERQEGLQADRADQVPGLRRGDVLPVDHVQGQLRPGRTRSDRRERLRLAPRRDRLQDHALRRDVQVGLHHRVHLFRARGEAPAGGEVRGGRILFSRRRHAGDGADRVGGGAPRDGMRGGAAGSGRPRDAARLSPLGRAAPPLRDAPAERSQAGEAETFHVAHCP